MLSEDDLGHLERVVHYLRSKLVLIARAGLRLQATLDVLGGANHQALHKAGKGTTGEVLPELERGPALHEDVTHGVRDEVQRVDGR